MNDLWHAVWLALLQGLTEFLPISSSAHLILLPSIAGWSDQGLAFDVAVHVGTLLAVVCYFYRELQQIVIDTLSFLKTRELKTHSKLGLYIILATIPVGLAGLTFKDFIEHQLRAPIVIAITTLVFGFALGWFDWRGKRTRAESSMTWRDALYIGIAQAIALIPGTSRSGITMTAGLALGLTRQAAARFSFLLSIPVIILAGGLEGLELVTHAAQVDWPSMLIGTAVSAVSAFLCIHFFLKLLERVGMMPFVLYRLALGVFLLWWM